MNFEGGKRVRRPERSNASSIDPESPVEHLQFEDSASAKTAGGSSEVRSPLTVQRSKRCRGPLVATFLHAR